jgi:hypothetical protein
LGGTPSSRAASHSEIGMAIAETSVNRLNAVASGTPSRCSTVQNRKWALLSTSKNRPAG